MKEVNRARLFRDFLKVGRVGSKYKLFGAPGRLEGPYDSPEEAEAAEQMIINSPDKFQIVDRKVVKVGKKKEK